MASPVIYRLSNAQAKELLVRGTELQIALPVPPHEVADPLAWARSALEPQIAELCVEAEETELSVAALRKPTPRTLADHLGHIHHDGSPQQLLQTVVVILVTLRPRQRRHTASRIQWPHTCLFLGEQVPPKEPPRKDTK